MKIIRILTIIAFAIVSSCTFAMNNNEHSYAQALAHDNSARRFQGTENIPHTFNTFAPQYHYPATHGAYYSALQPITSYYPQYYAQAQPINNANDSRGQQPAQPISSDDAHNDYTLEDHLAIHNMASQLEQEIENAAQAKRTEKSLKKNQEIDAIAQQLKNALTPEHVHHYQQEQNNAYYSTCTPTRAHRTKRTYTEAFNSTHTGTPYDLAQSNVMPASLLTHDYVPYDNDELTAIQDLANQLEINTIPVSKAARIEQVNNRTNSTSVLAARSDSVAQNNIISSGQAPRNTTTSLRGRAPISTMSESDRRIAYSPYHDFFPMIKNNTAPADLFSILVKHSHFKLDALLRLASYAKKEMHPDGVQAMCAHLQTMQNEYPESATKIISLLQKNDAICYETYKDAALQKNLTPQAVAAYFKHPALTVAQRCAMIENGNYCKDMWHTLANFYEKDALYAFLMKARESFSDEQKLEIFDYLCKNPLNCTKNGVPNHEKNNLATVQILQKLFDGKSPEGRDPLHKLFPVEKLPAQAFEKLANTPENKEKLLAQGKTLFSRGTVLEIKEAITQGIPCHNPSQFLSARFNHRQSQIIKNHAEKCNYDLSQTHYETNQTHSTNE